jgi:hypothetical protein
LPVLMFHHALQFLPVILLFAWLLFKDNSRIQGITFRGVEEFDKFKSLRDLLIIYYCNSNVTRFAYLRRLVDVAVSYRSNNWNEKEKDRTSKLLFWNNNTINTRSKAVYFAPGTGSRAPVLWARPGLSSAVVDPAPVLAWSLAMVLLGALYGSLWVSQYLPCVYPMAVDPIGSSDHALVTTS